MENEKPKVDITFYDVICFPEHVGNRVISSKYGKVDEGKKVRFDCSVPIPSNNEEAKALYNVTLSDLVAKGVRQHTYDENVVSNLIKENINRLETKEFIDQLRSELETALFVTPKKRKATKAKETQRLTDRIKNLYTTYGLNPRVHTEDDLIAAIQKG